MGKPKRERSANFTQEETDILLSLVKPKKRIIENKKSDATTWEEKETTWRSIALAFNNISKSVYRDHKHLKSKYEAIKRNARKKTIARAECNENGDSIKDTPKFTPAEEKVKKMIFVPIDGNEDSSSSDSEISWVEEQIPEPAAVLEQQLKYDPSSPDSETSRVKEEQIPEPSAIMVQDLRDDALSSDVEITRIEIEPSTAVQELKDGGGSTSVTNISDPVAVTGTTCRHFGIDTPQKKSLSERLKEEQIEIAKLKRKILTEEYDQMLIKRKILEKELQHKDVIHELEKEHLLLKIEVINK